MKQKPRQSAQKTIRRRVKHHARMAVVPHEHNKYRPHLIRRQGIAIVLMFALSLNFAYNSWQTGSVLGQKIDVSSQQMLDLTNEARVASGATSLVFSPQLANAAQLKAQDMFDHQYWSHTAPNGDTPWKWIKQAGYNYTIAGENLAKNFVSSRGIVTAWMDSPEHRKNLLDERFRDVGFAVVTGNLDDEPTTIVVALYGASYIAGATTRAQPEVFAARGSQSLVTRFGVALQSLSPTLLAAMVLFLLLAIVALAAHRHRDSLPKDRRTGWKRQHGLYKALGIFSIIVVVMAIYGSGQI